MPPAPKPSSPAPRSASSTPRPASCCGCGRTRDEIAAWGSPVGGAAPRRDGGAGGPDARRPPRAPGSAAAVMIYLGLAALALVLVALVLSDGSDSVGGVIGPDQLANLAWTGTILLLVVAGFWRQFTARLGANLQALLAWALIGLALVIGYSYRDRIQDVGASGARRSPAGERDPGRRRLGHRHTAGGRRFPRRCRGERPGAALPCSTPGRAASCSPPRTPPRWGSRPRPPSSPPASPPPTASPTRRRPSSTRSASGRSPSGGSTPWWPSRARLGDLLGQTFLSRLSGYEVRGDRLILRRP